MAELLHCPFCGGENIAIIPCYEENCGNECYNGCDDVKYTAVCRKSKNGCGASCCWHKTKEQVIEYWNIRTPKERGEEK
jgi:hypothetical protein